MSENVIFEESVEEDIEDVVVEDVEPEQSVLVGERGSHAPTLTVKEAALVLGKSVRALERSLLGKWGNKLPEGWTATKKMVEGKDEWQIVPPSDFRYDHLLDELRKQPSQREIQRIRPEDLMRPIRRSFEDAGPAELTVILRELSQAHRELAEERKLHVEDLRTLLQLQQSMRLLEVNSSETAKLRSELVEAQRDLITLRDQYKQLLSLPWWKRLFKRF